MELLLIEDDAGLGKSVRQGLEESGHSCQWVSHGDRGLELAASHKFDAVVLDMMLPDMGGMEILQRLDRKSTRLNSSH